MGIYICSVSFCEGICHGFRLFIPIPFSLSRSILISSFILTFNKQTIQRYKQEIHFNKKVRGTGDQFEIDAAIKSFLVLLFFLSKIYIFIYMRVGWRYQSCTRTYNTIISDNFCLLSFLALCKKRGIFYFI